MFSFALPVTKNKFVLKTLESILNQTYHNYELIIIDYTSDNKLKELIDSFSDNRIKYFKHQAFINPTDSWNFAFSKTNGEYLVLSSDDDVYYKSFLSVMDKLIKEHSEIDVLHSRIETINEFDEHISFSPGLPEYEDIFDFILHRYKGFREQSLSEFVIRKSAFDKIKGYINFEAGLCSDDATYFSLAKENGVVASNEILFKWRNSGFSLSFQGSASARLSAIYQYESWANNFINDLIPKDEYAKIKKDEILSLKPKYFNLLKSDILARYSDKILLVSLLVITANWLKNKKKFRLTAKCYLKAIINRVSMPKNKIANQ